MSKTWAILPRQASDNLLRECGYEVKDMTSPEVQNAADFIYDEVEKLGWPITMTASLSLAKRLQEILRASGHGAGREADIELAKQCVTVAAFACDEQSRKLLYAVAKHLLTPVALERTAGRMPSALTAENGAKAALIGEFYEEFEYVNEDGEDDCVKVPVTWTTIKKIYEKIVQHFDAAPSPDDQPEKQA